MDRRRFGLLSKPPFLLCKIGAVAGQFKTQLAVFDRSSYLRLMRSFFAVLILTTPAHAWEFTPGVPCLLTHDTGATQIELTYDPRQPLYSITVSQDAAMPDSPFFAMRFDGPRPNTIASARHEMGNNNRSVTVTDTGFGNVLDGLQYNISTTIILAETMLTVSLKDASGPVQLFRDCVGPAPSV